MIFFSSDTHYGHENIIKHCRRPYSNVDEMNEDYIRKWNEVVTEQDTTYLLGDVAYRHDKTCDVSDILDQLKGEIHLILGNHDEDWKGNITIPIDRFQSVSHYKQLYLADDRRFVMSHYPMDSWNGSFSKGTIMLHGHSHGMTKPKKKNRLDVGVDSHEGYPWSLEEVLNKLRPGTKKEPF